jgi:hypothetical protein
MLTVKQRSELQQAIWKLQAAKELVSSALGDTDSGQISIHAINDAIDDLQADLDDDSVDN